MSLTLLSTVLALSCSADGGDPAPQSVAPAPPRFQLDSEVLQSDLWGPMTQRPFDLLASDMDLDGDQDLIVNRHFFGLMLYENKEGRLSLLNSVREDEAGLDMPPGVRTMFAAAGIEKLVEGPAVIAVQPLAAEGELDVVARSPRHHGPASLRIGSHDNLAVEEGEGWKRISPSEVEVPFPGKGAEVRLRVQGQGRTPRFSLTQLDEHGALERKPLDFVMGADRDRFPGPKLEWWSADPHGMAWAQIDGSPEPDLVVVRGGNVGKLMTEGIEKEHLFYRYQGLPDARFVSVQGALPPDDTRGRSAEWVDVDGDGTNELYITNRDGNNELLVWRPTKHAFEERGDIHGVAQTCSELGTWMDVDRDGWQDLVLLCDGRFDVAHNVGVGAFVVENGSRYGLVLPDMGPPPHGWLREDGLHVLDLNGDDFLDLVISGAGRDRRILVYLGGPQGFRDATSELGLADERDTLDIRPFDADMDGYMDLLVAGEHPHLLWNRGGSALQSIPMEQLLVGGVKDLGPPHLLMTPIDLDSDGRMDLVICGRTWRTARNVTKSASKALSIVLDSGTRPPPVGTLLRAAYVDGHVQRVRYGSHGRTDLSQAFPAVRFGVPNPGALLRVEVQWAGKGDWVPVQVPVDGGVVHLAVPTIGL